MKTYYRNKFKNTIAIIFSFILASNQIIAQDTLIFSDIDGKISVEAEHFMSQEKTNIRQWYIISSTFPDTVLPDADPNHYNGASNKEYLEILPDTRRTHDDPLVHGVSFSNLPGILGVLSYRINFTSSGKYYVWVRAHSTGTEDNGIHVGINGSWPSSGQRMQWCDGKNTWYWESKQRTDANHCGEPFKIFLEVSEPGIHTVHFSMREDGFEFDKFILTKDINYRPSGLGPDEFIISSVSELKVDKNYFYLEPNYPNPFNPMTTLSFNLEQSSNINLSIYDINGELVKELLDKYHNKGKYSVDWDGTNLRGQTVSSGIYLGRLKNFNNFQAIKMIFSK